MFIGKPSISAAGLANFSHRFRPRRRQKISSTASTSIPLNIAEGNGKFSARDRARFFEMARGSALECAACLDVLIARTLTTGEKVTASKEQLVRIVEMLVGLLRRFSDRADVLREESPDYLFDHDYEHEQEHAPRP